MSIIRTERVSTAIAKAGPVDIRAGTERRDLVCRECGYGIRVSKPARRCPMCHSFDWCASARGNERVEDVGLERRPRAL
jgi:primosomal protein N'